MSSTPRENQGPTWWDVERHLVDLTKRCGSHVTVQRVWSQDARSERFTWHAHVSVKGYRKGKPDAVRGASHAFRGNGGSATMPAAIVVALFKLEEALAEAEEDAQQQALF